MTDKDHRSRQRIGQEIVRRTEIVIIFIARMDGIVVTLDEESVLEWRADSLRLANVWLKI